ncbi:MAG: DUF4345 family protein [Pseudomonadota bacterium]
MSTNYHRHPPLAAEVVKLTVYLILTGILFVAFGLFALIDPVRAVAIPYAIGAAAPDARNYLRAGAGGVTTAAGLVMLLATYYQALILVGLMIAVIFFTGLVSGRVVSRILDGPWGSVVVFAFWGEIIGLVFGVYWVFEFSLA